LATPHRVVRSQNPHNGRETSSSSAAGCKSVAVLGRQSHRTAWQLSAGDWGLV